MAKQVKWMSTAEYVEYHNKHNEEKITRKDVYKMISQGKLSAEKNARGHWIIKVTIEEQVEYTPSEFVEEYNKKHKKETITVEMVRKMAANGVIKAHKVGRKWVILQSPKKKIKQ